MVGWSRTTVLGAAVVFSETADTDGFAEVYVASYGGGAGVEPVFNKLVGSESSQAGRGGNSGWVMVCGRIGNGQGRCTSR